MQKLEERRREYAKAILAGGSFLDEEEDPFGGMTPEASAACLGADGSKAFAAEQLSGCCEELKWGLGGNPRWWQLFLGKASWVTRRTYLAAWRPRWARIRSSIRVSTSWRVKLAVRRTLRSK